MTYMLRNCEEQHAASPETFELPPLGLRKALGVGFCAKLIFLENEGGERMWVQITKAEYRDGYGTAADTTRYEGILTNQPVSETIGARQRDLIIFGPEHIADIEPPPVAVASYKEAREAERHQPERHAVNEVGECASWCRVCARNVASGLFPDGTEPLDAGGL